MIIDVKKNRLTRILALALVIAVGVTFTPMFGDIAYAATQGETAKVNNNLGTPTNYPSQYAVYSNYMDFATSTNFMYGTIAMYMEYRVRGGAWKTSGSMSQYMTTYKISGLKPNSVYQTRVYFGQWYNGVFYRGPYSKITTIKTGKAGKLPIKSVKVQAVKVKKHKGTAWYYFWRVGSYKYYTYKVKVTVTLKKKPGAAGIWINSKKVKGNKKKYSVTFGPYSSYTKPKGKKFTVYTYSYQNPTYGGYTQMYQKTKKIK